MVIVKSLNITIHKLVWDRGRINCFTGPLSDNLVEIDLLVDRIENGNLNINDGVEIFGTILYNKLIRFSVKHNGKKLPI